MTGPDEQLNLLTMKKTIHSALSPLLAMVSFLILTPLLIIPVKGQASGKLTYKSANKTIEIPLQNVVFLSGPDPFEKDKMIRRLVFSEKDLSGGLTTCNDINCLDSIMEGIQFDLNNTARINYWLSLDNQKIQYSGTAPREVLVLLTDKPDRLTGTLRLDNTGAGGPVVEITFDATRSKLFR